ncbi:MAG: SDR family oxidoreductase, partial [Clostridia bacterium]|nr:SDR family oxidoreductase [Clostridia bacterium]
EGAFVIGLELNQASCEKATAEIEAMGGKCMYISCDISSEEAVDKAFAQIAERVDHLDGLYNNASVFLNGKDGPIGDIDPAIWKKVLAINLDGTYYCTRKALPMMMERGGSIIHTASSAGVTGIPACAAYTATKGAMVTLTRSMAVDYGKYNIRTNCIAPAAIATDMVKASNLSDPNFNEQKFLEMVTPLRRWGTPEDVAALACFLMSDEASYLNGNTIRADGGITVNGDVNR